jgi:hypothetical protein
MPTGRLPLLSTILAFDAAYKLLGSWEKRSSRQEALLILGRPLNLWGESPSLTGVWHAPLSLSWHQYCSLGVASSPPLPGQAQTSPSPRLRRARKCESGRTLPIPTKMTNLGSVTATGVVFGDPLPDPLNLVSFTCGRGINSGGSFCAVESGPSGASITATLMATPITNPAKSERRFSHTPFISQSTTPHPNSTNNSASVETRIVGHTP